MRRTDNYLREAKTLKRTHGGSRHIKDKVTQFTSSRRGVPFIELDMNAYKLRRRVGGTRRF